MSVGVGPIGRQNCQKEYVASKFGQLKKETVAINLGWSTEIGQLGILSMLS